MALYKYQNLLERSDHAAFEMHWKPGEAPPNSGIYRCANCGDEIAANKGNPLPPQNHHQHRNGYPILWQLTVCAVQR